MDSPTKSMAKRKKSSNTHTSQKRTSARLTFTPPPQPIFRTDSPKLTPNPPQNTQLPQAFETPKAVTKTHPPPTPPTHEIPALDEDSDEADFLEELEGLRGKEDTDQTAGIFDIGGVFQKDADNQLQMKAPTQEPAQREWSIISTSADRPDLNHHSDNPYDFLPVSTLEKLVKYWKKEEEKEPFVLTKVEKATLGDPRIGKVIAKVVHSGPMPLNDEKKNAWVRSAIISIASQNKSEFNPAKLRNSINPGKLGYSWIIFLVPPTILDAMKDIRGALDPRSGTLVLFRPWKNETFQTQRVYAFGIHLENDQVPQEVASDDYEKQIKESLTKRGLRLVGMKPAHYGEAAEVCTEITLGFTEGTKPIIITPQVLPRSFWTGFGNTKPKRGITHKWPSKCRLCESETHLTSKCPWPEVEKSDRKPNLQNCCLHPPGWVELPKKQKTMHPKEAPTTKLIRPKREGKKESSQTLDKGKAKAVDVEMETSK